MDSALRLDISLSGALRAIGQVGDLSMGQPLGHSRRVATLAQRLAQAAHGEGEHLAVAEQVALLRWSGCTANAEGFADLLGDDVDGRRAMLDLTLSREEMTAVHQATPLAVVHCEVSGEVARTLELGEAVQAGLCRVFETYDGTGRPLGLTHEHIPEVAYQVVLAGDLDILSRAHGLDAALRWIRDQSDRRYPAALASLLADNANDWLTELENSSQAPASEHAERSVSLTLVGDVIDLKLPWLAGHSRRVALLAMEAARLWGVSEPTLTALGKAALVYGLGRAAVSNQLWNTAGALPYGAVERVHLVPYWTQQALRPISELVVPAQIAAHAYERLDGSGYFRGVMGDALCAEHRLFATTVAWVALREARPWRAAHGESEAARLLEQEAVRGLFDKDICDAVIAAARGERRAHQPKASLLTARECDVLQEISRGASNKQVARLLDISPSTVRTHMESIFRKLQCSTRAAATLKGLTLGLIS
ncbi:LuxR C-terminal-related transcriptional regulator [Pseudomonas sp. 21TX0197]|uniref:HD domain-containing phosphohydrolase n=1 Tax=Pseudomonas TaxID=286 RepID=UPI0009221438|nr:MULTISPECIES: HD domain-containing phosphohydrolase [Pseudomonas]MDB6442514.1 LuxR C-terminal-related transcriptional regulator [Pseudomonas sp. 21TX0197]MDT8909093.1 LuxR C-terminal-related transcriptional regulator [Pseudomonas prosekii]ROO40450.1 phosphohydrolase [Pseudomonas sp. 7SR1]SFY00046.1 HD domain-containing protein [Pseudomonas sp. NFACC36]SIS25765.1 HD domain-containing protein [Pseudomonas sp. 7SR1]